MAITPTSKFIRCAGPHKILVTFHPSYAGHFEDTLELVFTNIVKRHRFVIQRKISATVGSRADHEHLAPTAPYTQRKRRNIKLDGPVKRSLRPPTWTPTKWISKLPQFDVPQNLVQAVYTEKGDLKRSARQDVKRFMPSSFNITTYARYFQTIIYLDEEGKQFVSIFVAHWTLCLFHRTGGLWPITLWRTSRSKRTIPNTSECC